MSLPLKEYLEDVKLPLAEAPKEPRRVYRGRVCSLGFIVLAAFGMIWVNGCRLLSFTRDLKNASEDWRKLAIGTVKWGQCEGPNTLNGSDCGYIIVPMNYLDPGAGVAKVALARYNATKSPRKGMVLFNFGGPGGTATSRIAQAPSYQATVIGEDYDWVGFDPRGIGETEPKLQCFPPGGSALFRKNTVLDKGFDVPRNLSDPHIRPHLLRQQIEADSLYETQFEICKHYMGDALSYMGTTIVSRDIDFITTFVEGEHALINYYGYSYGTILGAYLVNMFPHRVGRIVIDGVADAVAWSGQPPYTWYRQWLGYTEPAYELFLSQCSKAGPKSCPLAKFKDEPTKYINDRIEKFYDELYYKPMPVPDAISPGILTNGVAREPLFSSLQGPGTWPVVASALQSAISGNATDLFNLHGSFYRDLERSAVTCNDVSPFKPPNPEDVVDIALGTLRDVTRFAQTVVTTEPDAGCQFWPGNPPERFTGPWNHTLRNPILVHSNLLDPVTPISSGRKVKELLGDSARLAIRVGPGHCSSSLPSLCTVRINRAFFAEGTLPPNEHVCGVDVSPFGVPMDNNVHTTQYTMEEENWLKHLHILAKNVYL